MPDPAPVRASEPVETVLLSPTASEATEPLPVKDTASPLTRFVKVRVDPFTVVVPS